MTLAATDARTLTIRIENFSPPREYSPNVHVHWSKRYSAGEGAKALAKYTTAKAMETNAWRPLSGPLAVSVVVGLGKGEKINDLDNLSGRCKPILDGVANAIDRNDRDFVPTYRQERSKDGRPFVMIEIREGRT